MKTILLVDHKQRHRVAAKWFLSNFGYAVDAARNAEEALLLFDPKVHDVVLTDYLMPGMTGVELAHVVKLRSPSTPVIMFTEQPSEHQSCVDCVIQRSAHLLAVKEAVDRLLDVGHE